MSAPLKCEWRQRVGLSRSEGPLPAAGRFVAAYAGRGSARSCRHPDAAELLKADSRFRSRATHPIRSAVTSLLERLQALEVELHHPGVRCSRERLEQLLASDFYEVGRSGREYYRNTVIDFLLSQATPPNVRSENFHVVELAQGVALLTYRSAHVESNGQLANHSLRSSIWVKLDGRWQVRYHQGTPAAEVW